MAVEPLSQLDNWELVHEDADIRGKTVYDQYGNQIGKVDELLVDTDREAVIAVTLDNGQRYPADAIHFENGRVTLLRDEQAPGRSEDTSGRTFDLKEEQLRAQKTSEKAGEVQVHKEVVSERKSMDVPKSREEVFIEREDIPDRPAEQPIGEEETISVPVYEEHVKPEKETVVSEEVQVGKRRVEDTETVSAELKKEKAKVDRQGDVDFADEDNPDNPRNQDNQ